MEKHTFIGIPISNEIASFYEQVQKVYQLPKHYKKIVNKEDFHLTLLFLGSWQPEKRVQLWKRLQTDISEIPSFSITFSNLNYFGGDHKQPRVFYVGNETENRLIHLQSLIQKEAELLDFPKENRKYKPHMTLAKKWSDMTQGKPDDWNFPEKITRRNQLIDRISLFQIHPSRDPMYEQISTIHLAKEI